MRIVRPSRSIVFGALSLLFAGWIIISAAPPKNVDYPYYGGDPGAMRYSTLTQINAKNAAQLKEVWRYDLGGAGDDRESTDRGQRNYLRRGHDKRPMHWMRRPAKSNGSILRRRSRDATRAA